MATSTPPATIAPEPPAAQREPRELLRRLSASPTAQGSVTFIAFIVVFAVFALWLGNQYVSTDARFLDIHQNTPVLLLALAVLVTLIAGQFDLSVASMATLTSFLSVGLAIKQEWPFGVVLLICAAAGLAGGALNGLLVVRFRVNTFIATLATGGVFLGLSKVYSGGVAQTPGEGEALPGWFAGPTSLGAFGAKVPDAVGWLLVAALVVGAWGWLRQRPVGALRARTWDLVCAGGLAAVVAVAVALGLDGIVGAVSWTMLVLLAVATVMWLLLGHTTFGRYLQATGYNPQAARLTGIDTGKETFKAFVIGGFLAALAGVMLSANQGAATPDNAAGFLLPAFAAAFLSTVVLSTGRFTVWGAVVGGVFLVWVSQGLIVGGVPFTWTDVVNGVVLALAVAVSTVLRRRTS